MQIKNLIEGKKIIGSQDTQEGNNEQHLIIQLITNDLLGQDNSAPWIYKKTVSVTIGNCGQSALAKDDLSPRQNY
jgi:hypothetical protein